MRNKRTCMGIPYIHTSEFEKMNTEDIRNAFVVIIAEQYYGVGQVKILQYLFNAGVDKMFALPENERYQVYGTRIPFNEYFREHIDDLEHTYNLLDDEDSRRIMEEYVRAILECDYYRLEQCHGRNKYFYDGPTVKNRRNIYEHLEDEVWINCGANVGDSIFLYFDNGLNAKKVYAYEGDKNCYETLCRGLECLPERFRKKVEPINEFISESTLFSKYINEKVTFLNADIQGNELGMLCAMEKIIKKDRPVLAVCVYHLKEDLVEIPQYINSLVHEYKFVLRKYAAGATEATRTSELVLYAVPEERYLLK